MPVYVVQAKVFNCTNKYEGFSFFWPIVSRLIVCIMFRLLVIIIILSYIILNEEDDEPTEANDDDRPDLIPPQW
jgi:Tfp pilus assembly protein PilO